MMNALLEPFVDPVSRTYFGGLLVAFVLALFLTRHHPDGPKHLFRPFWTASTALDIQLLVARRLLGMLGLFPALAGSFALAMSIAVPLRNLIGEPLSLGHSMVPIVLYTVTLFIVWDASRFLAHLAMHRVPFLWVFHQVHHSAESMTPLTFHRLHPVESLVYQLRSVLVTGVLAGVFHGVFGSDATYLQLYGVHAVGFVFNLVFGNLRHSEVWWSFGSWETWFISPAQHQVHHGVDTDRVNYGTWLAIWDRLYGSWQAAEEPVTRFGVTDANHGHDLVSAYVGPFRQLFRR